MRRIQKPSHKTAIIPFDWAEIFLIWQNQRNILHDGQILYGFIQTQIHDTQNKLTLTFSEKNHFVKTNWTERPHHNLIDLY